MRIRGGQGGNWPMTTSIVASRAAVVLNDPPTEGSGNADDHFNPKRCPRANGNIDTSEPESTNPNLSRAPAAPSRETGNHGLGERYGNTSTWLMRWHSPTAASFLHRVPASLRLQFPARKSATRTRFLLLKESTTFGRHRLQAAPQSDPAAPRSAGTVLRAEAPSRLRAVR